jgi:hypothetical protein
MQTKTQPRLRTGLRIGTGHMMPVACLSTMSPLVLLVRFGGTASVVDRLDLQCLLDVC